MVTTENKIVAADSARAVAATPAPVLPKVATTPAAPVVAAKTVSKVTVKPAAKKSALIAKASVKSPVKSSIKATTKASAKPLTKPLAKLKAEKLVKAQKPKQVRDSFTIPKAEYTVLDGLKQRAGKLTSAAKKSELIRAGVKALAAMSDVAFLAALKAVPAIKTGRPAKAKAN